MLPSIKLIKVLVGYYKTRLIINLKVFFQLVAVLMTFQWLKFSPSNLLKDVVIVLEGLSAKLGGVDGLHQFVHRGCHGDHGRLIILEQRMKN